MDFIFQVILHLYAVARSSTEKSSAFFHPASHNGNILEYSTTKLNQEMRTGTIHWHYLSVTSFTCTYS